jgi:hypothetical protein
VRLEVAPHEAKCAKPTLGFAHSFGVPGMAHTQGVKVPGAPGSGKRVADGKGVRREAESEGSRRRNLGPRNTNRIRRTRRVRLQNKPKPHSCTEAGDVNAAGTRGERRGPYPGRPHGREGERKGAGHPGEGTGNGPPAATANREESAEAIVAATPAAKGRTQTEGVTERDHARGRGQTTST